jgi:Fic family protein
MAKYIYEYPDWNNFTWQDKEIYSIFGAVRQMQGKIKGSLSSIGFSGKDETVLNALTLDLVKSWEIEGEFLDYQEVRSSIARRLGINTGGLVPSSKPIEGVVEMLLDATQNFNLPLTHQRLFNWHAALFPTGYSGMYKIEVGKYRTGEMQIVSGAFGKEKIHYEAIPSKNVLSEMDRFLDWINNENQLDNVLKSAIAHFWFIIIHPFDDGNGRIARAISDMLLARAEESGVRFYSFSAQILVEKKIYYEVLQKVQHSSGDITDWLKWFFSCLIQSMQSAEFTIQKIIRKIKFWKLIENIELNERQRFMINLLIDNFEGKLQTSKWAKISKCSNDTALRDIKDLIVKGILMQTDEKGKNANYILTELY